MQIEKNKVVTFHYTVTDTAGATIDSSRDRGPMAVLIGYGGLIPGLEKAFEGRAAGDRFEVSVAPEDAYGPRVEGQQQRVPKKYFRDADRLRPGMTTALALKEGGQRPVTVIKVGSSVVDIDLNHPLAGQTLAFDVEIIAVRDGDAEEIAHRHVHGDGGHAHG
ncbi:FKBP-type peptidyl-prolyl cis-trans isomerase [Dokdonella sp. MW10]|uniref:FKBP-type peptidyl-prolyl cis-trans isomerase n=1 Tax=Dokdonella sp. MW10 TaxID=2992926 RepID=UPI003F7ECEE9